MAVVFLAEFQSGTKYGIQNVLSVEKWLWLKISLKTHYKCFIQWWVWYLWPGFCTEVPPQGSLEQPQDEPFFCLGCGKKFATKQQLKEHILLYRDSSLFVLLKCSQCSIILDSIATLNGHIWQWHDRYCLINFICHHYSITFGSIYTPNYHLG